MDDLRRQVGLWDPATAAQEPETRAHAQDVWAEQKGQARTGVRAQDAYAELVGAAPAAAEDGGVELDPAVRVALRLEMAPDEEKRLCLCLSWNLVRALPYHGWSMQRCTMLDAQGFGVRSSGGDPSHAQDDFEVGNCFITQLRLKEEGVSYGLVQVGMLGHTLCAAGSAHVVFVCCCAAPVQAS
jgi:hypothetical protein